MKILWGKCQTDCTQTTRITEDFSDVEVSTRPSTLHFLPGIKHWNNTCISKNHNSWYLFLPIINECKNFLVYSIEKWNQGR